MPGMGNLPGVVGWGSPETTKTELVKVWHGCFIRFSQVLLIAHSSVDRYNSAQGKTEKAFPVYSLPPPPSPFPSPFPLKMTFGVIPLLLFCDSISHCSGPYQVG